MNIWIQTTQLLSIMIFLSDILAFNLAKISKSSQEYRQKTKLISLEISEKIYKPNLSQQIGSINYSTNNLVKSAWLEMAPMTYLQ
jgi:hypothetical protein